MTDQKSVVSELTRFYRAMADYPVYQARCLIYWRQIVEAGSNPYIGAYSEFIRQMGGNYAA